MSRQRSALIDTRIIYCGDCLEQLAKLPDTCVDLVYIDPPFNSNRNYEAFWGETKEKRAFEDRHASTQAYIEYMRPQCVELARVLKDTGSFYYHCDWHASHYVKVMLDQIFGENNFQNEIVWKRSDAHSDAKQGQSITAGSTIQSSFTRRERSTRSTRSTTRCQNQRLRNGTSMSKKGLADVTTWLTLLPQRRAGTRNLSGRGTFHHRGGIGRILVTSLRKWTSKD